MASFESPLQEGMLALFVAASELRAKMDRMLADSGITSEQFNILRILRGAHPDGHACGEVANRMIDRSPDITRRIDALEKQGYVERERSTNDRRVVIARITEKGLALLQTVVPQLQAFEREVTQNMSETELHELARLCEKMIELNTSDQTFNCSQ